MRWPRLRISRTELAVFAGVLAVAFGVRLAGLTFGLPHVYHPDEGFEVYRAVRLGMGGFDFTRVAKGGYYFLLFAEYGLYFLKLLITGKVHGASDFALHFITSPESFWKIGRFTTALLGTLTVLVVWFQGRRIAGSRAGLLGAWFLALSFRHVIDSHYITVDVPMALFTFLAIVMIVEDVSLRSRLNPWLFALVAAYAVLNKLPAVILFITYFLGAYLRGGWRRKRGVLTGSTLGPVALAAAIYIIANPGFVLNFMRMVALVSASVAPAASTGGVEPAAAATNLWAFYWGVLVESQGPASLSLSFLGIALMLIHRSRAAVLHASFLVLFFLLIAATSSSHLYYARYVIPLLPGLCLFAGLGLDDLISRLRVGRRLETVLAVFVGVLLVVEPAWDSVQWDRQQMRTDTRTLAAEWIEAHVPHGARVLLEGSPEETAQLAVPLRDTKRNIREMIARLEESDPGKAMFWQLKAAAQEKPMYDLVTVRHDEDWGTLAQYVEAGVQVVVLRRQFFVAGGPSTAKFAASQVATRHRFYADLQAAPEARLAAAFAASPGGAPGYDIEIWLLGSGLPGQGEAAADGEAE
jgi:hypothetical protein